MRVRGHDCCCNLRACCSRCGLPRVGIAPNTRWWLTSLATCSSGVPVPPACASLSFLTLRVVPLSALRSVLPAPKAGDAPPGSFKAKVLANPPAKAGRGPDANLYDPDEDDDDPLAAQFRGPAGLPYAVNPPVVDAPPPVPAPAAAPPKPALRGANPRRTLAGVKFAQVRAHVRRCVTSRARVSPCN